MRARVPDIICLSHLEWEDTLFQRPQQLMLRFAQLEHRTFYFAQRSLKKHLLSFAGRAAARHGQPADILRFWNLPGYVGPENAAALKRAKLRALQRRIEGIVAQHQITNPILWLYYPEHFPLVSEIQHSRLVYDCMDPFAHFRAAGESLAENERQLLQAADVVFTGGRSLQAAKEGVNPNTHCFPSGVDVDHFARARRDDTPIPPDIANIAGPILGYFGALDERIDFELIGAICRARPDWSVVLIGPLVGLSALPVSAPNCHHLGKKRYADLPGYLKAFDVCLMPFADSELTRRLSPTKTPEYLAGGKPVISTPIPDVVADFSEVADFADAIAIAHGAEEFCQCIATALERKAPLADHGAQLAATRSWSHIAKSMQQLMLK